MVFIRIWAYLDDHEFSVVIRNIIHSYLPSKNRVLNLHVFSLSYLLQPHFRHISSSVQSKGSLIIFLWYIPGDVCLGYGDSISQMDWLVKFL